MKFVTSVESNELKTFLFLGLRTLSVGTPQRERYTMMSFSLQTLLPRAGEKRKRTSKEGKTKTDSCRELH